MNDDYKVGRVADQIKNLQSEQKQLSLAIDRAKKDEQYELEKIKQEFKKRISSMEYRQSSIMLELNTKQRELSNLEERAREARKPPVSAIQQAKENRLRPHL